MRLCNILAMFESSTRTLMAKTVRLYKKQKPSRKYGIIDQVNMLDRKITISDLLAHLSKQGISRDEFYADRNIAYGSDKSIPSDRLFKYAQVFDCSVEDLLNEDIKATSIRQQRLKSPKSPMR